jgi:hypothetical protein
MKEQNKKELGVYHDYDLTPIRTGISHYTPVNPILLGVTGVHHALPGLLHL